MTPLHKRGEGWISANVLWGEKYAKGKEKRGEM
jgi:hypothetical protein